MAGERVSVRGRLSSTRARRVLLQVRSGGRWKTLAKSTTRRHRYSIPIRLTRAVTRLRVVAPRISKRPGLRAAVTAVRAVRLAAQSVQLTGPAMVKSGQQAALTVAALPIRRARRIRLERLVGTSFVSQGTLKTDSAGRATFSTVPPAATNTYRAVALPFHGARSGTSARWTVAAATDPPSTGPPATNPPSTNPTGPNTIGITRDLTLTVGSATDVDILDQVDSFESLTLEPSPTAGVSWRGATDQPLHVEANLGSSPGSTTLEASGTACVADQCQLPFHVTVHVTVTELQDVSAGSDSFTGPSEDRIAASDQIGTMGMASLADEVLLTIGTDDVPGTLARAKELAASVGASVTGGLESAGIYELRWSPAPDDLQAAVDALLAQPDVVEALASPMAPVGEQALPPGDWSDDGEAITWPFTRIRAQQAWDLAKGTGVKVGILDSGRAFGDHEDLTPVSFTGPPNALNNVSDCDNGTGAVHGHACHASHVAGLACAAANGIGVVGVAWGCRVTSSGLPRYEDGARLTKDVLQYGRELAESGVRVVNMSLGRNFDGSCTTQPESDELNSEVQRYDATAGVRRLFNDPVGRNVVWTLAAGNNCGEGVHSGMGVSWALPNVVTVAASNSDSKLASYSNAGPGVEVAAPGGVGVNIAGAQDGPISTMPVRCGPLGRSTCSTYSPSTGTSMAAPIVAGVAALAFSAAPSRTAAEVGSCIVGTAGTRTGFVRSESNLPDGYTRTIPLENATPILDAEATVRCAQGAPQTAEILVTGQGDRTASGNGTDIGDVTAALSAAGHDVVIASALPADLSGYQQVWDIDTDAWSQTEQDRVHDYVAAGGSLYLTGEWGCCSVDSSTIALINSLVPGQTVAHAGWQGTDSWTIASDAPFGLATTPNAVTYLQTASPGALSGVLPGHVVAGTADASVFSAWGPSDVQGGGRIAVVMDVNWLAEQYRGTNWGDLLENIAAFL